MVTGRYVGLTKTNPDCDRILLKVLKLLVIEAPWGPGPTEL